MFALIFVIYLTRSGTAALNMREFGFRDQSSTWLLDRILRVGVTPKLVPLRVTLGEDHLHYLRLVTFL